MTALPGWILQKLKPYYLKEYFCFTTINLLQGQLLTIKTF